MSRNVLATSTTQPSQKMPTSTAAADGLRTVQTGAGIGCHCQYRINSAKLANST